jgi:hypothetical protein
METRVVVILAAGIPVAGILVVVPGATGNEMADVPVFL